MVLSMSNTFTQKAVQHRTDYKESELQEAVIQNLDKLGIPKEEVNVNENGHIELGANYNGLKIHTLMLQMESMGLNMKMTKKTLLEVY